MGCALGGGTNRLCGTEVGGAVTSGWGHGEGQVRAVLKEGEDSSGRSKQSLEVGEVNSLWWEVEELGPVPQWGNEGGGLVSSLLQVGLGSPE